VRTAAGPAPALAFLLSLLPSLLLAAACHGSAARPACGDASCLADAADGAHDLRGADLTAGGDGRPGGLVAAYAFDEASGSVAADSSGGFHNAGLVGAVTWGTGHSGGDASLNGGYVVMPPGMLDDAHALSFAAWVRLRTQKTWQRVFDFGAGTGRYLFLSPNSDAATVRFAAKSAGSAVEQRAEVSMVLEAGGWRHLAVVVTGSGATIYVDGQAAASSADVTLRPADIAPMTNLWIGRSAYAADAPLDGEIDDVRIYDRALSAAEVLALASQ
jgi:hypothetical protein